jgi:hypothetical protein
MVKSFFGAIRKGKRTVVDSACAPSWRQGELAMEDMQEGPDGGGSQNVESDKRRQEASPGSIDWAHGEVERDDVLLGENEYESLCLPVALLAC